MYPEVFKKAHLLHTLPERLVKKLKKSTNLNFEADRHDEIRDVVTTIVHSHANTATPMDVEKRLMAMSGGDGAGSHDPTHVKDDTADAGDNHDGYYGEGACVNYVGKGGGVGRKGGKSKGKGTGRSEGTRAGHLAIAAGIVGARERGKARRRARVARSTTATARAMA